MQQIGEPLASTHPKAILSIFFLLKLILSLGATRNKCNPFSHLKNLQLYEKTYRLTSFLSDDQCILTKPWSPCPSFVFTKFSQMLSFPCWSSCCLILVVLWQWLHLKVFLSFKFFFSKCLFQLLLPLTSGQYVHVCEFLHKETQVIFVSMWFSYR